MRYNMGTGYPFGIGGTSIVVGRLSMTAAVLAGILAGCAYTGGDDPVTRKLTWFSYLNGDDIRAACVPGAPDRARLVYNGVYIEQIRTYDIVTEGDRPKLSIRVVGPADLRAIRAESPESIMAPWMGRRETVVLPGGGFDLLRRVLESDAARPVMPGDERLESDDFYWIVDSCFDGKFAFNAFRWPSARFRDAAFPGLIAGWDVTGIPVNAPRHVESISDDERKQGIHFSLKVGSGGLFGVGTLF